MIDQYKANQLVIDLHLIARIVENDFGKCNASVKIREAADSVSDLVKEQRWKKTTTADSQSCLIK